MASFTVTTTTAQDAVLQWELDNRNRDSRTQITADELIQQLIDNFLSEREGHFDNPRERLARLTPQEKIQIPLVIRKKLGL